MLRRSKRKRLRETSAKTSISTSMTRPAPLRWTPMSWQLLFCRHQPAVCTCCKRAYTVYIHAVWHVSWFSAQHNARLRPFIWFCDARPSLRAMTRLLQVCKPSWQSVRQRAEKLPEPRPQWRIPLRFPYRPGRAFISLYLLSWRSLGPSLALEEQRSNSFQQSRLLSAWFQKL